MPISPAYCSLIGFFFVFLYYFNLGVTNSRLATFAAFIYVYAKDKLSHRSGTGGMKGFRHLIIFLAAVCIAKAAVSIMYTIQNFIPGTFPWLYYLADSLAWLLLCIFFAFYSRSRLVRMSVHKTRHNYSRTHLDEKIERAGRN